MTAVAWLLVAAWQRSPAALVSTATAATFTVATTLAVFVLLSPALWHDPSSRLADLVRERQGLVARQATFDPRGLVPVSGRLYSLWYQPFIAPIEHADVPGWGTDPMVRAERAHYEASALGGAPFGALLGVPLTVLAMVGAVTASQRRHGGLLTWMVVAAVAHLVTPLPWQRYALPLVPVWTLLASLGLVRLGRWTAARLPLPPRRGAHARE